MNNLIFHKNPHVFKKVKKSSLTPFSYLLILALVMLVGSTILLVSHNYFHQLRNSLSNTASNEKARMLIGKQIVTDLLLIKSHFYQLLPEGQTYRRDHLEKQISTLLTEIGTALHIIEHGGTFDQTMPLNLPESDRLISPISYFPEKSEMYILEVIKLRPLLLEIEEKIQGLEELLTLRDKAQQSVKGSDLLLIRRSILTYLKNTEPLFIRLTEESNSLFYYSSKRLQEIENEVAQLSQKYQKFESIFIFVIFFTTFSLCFILARKILSTNSQLKKEIKERQQAEISISQAKNEWERTFDTVSDPIALLDVNHKIFRLNKAMAMIIGKPVEECVGLSCYKVMHKADAPPPYCPHSLLLEDLREHKTEQYLPNFDAYFAISVSPLVDSEGKLFGSVHIARDITDRKKAEKELQEANEALEQKVKERTAELEKFIDELKEEMITRKQAEEALVHTQHQLLHAEKLSAVGKLSASIAHEFNNPLFAIMNILIGVRQQESLTSQNERMLELAVQECDRIKKLIQSLQDFNRPTSGIPETTNIHQILDNMVLLCKKDFKDRKITVKKEYAPDMPAIKAVTDQIRQVVLNLLTNARDACVNGGTITISTEVLDNDIVISVSDSGCGIEPEDVDSIFKPFFSTKQEFSGTGLGLAVCHGIVEKHGGEISVSSTPLQGSVFTITLPKEAEEERVY